MFPWCWFVLRLVVEVVSLLFIWLHNFLANLGLFCIWYYVYWCVREVVLCLLMCFMEVFL